MRKRFTAIVLALAILLSLAVTGCSGRKTEGGLIFASVSSISDQVRFNSLTIGKNVAVIYSFAAYGVVTCPDVNVDD